MNPATPSSLAGLVSIATLPGRTTVLACVIVVPLLRFLLRNDYGIWRLESVAAAGILLLVCGVLAALVRNRTAFLVLTGVCSVLMATVPAVRLAAPWIELSPRMAALWLGLALAAAVALMRDRFAVVLTVFTLSAFATDIGVSMMGATRTGASTVQASATGSSRRLPHVLYVVLDEHMGSAGLPTAFPECRSAQSALGSVLEGGRFHHFTHAYSNYPSTVSSLASVLNRRLLQRRRTYLSENSQEWRWGTRTFQQNRLLATYQQRGYRIEVFQHRAINHIAPGIRNATVHEYWDELGRLSRAPGPWDIRFRWLVGNYQQSDLVVSQVKAFFPFRFAPHTTGPLAAADVWPSGPVAALERAEKPTFVFVHLIAPHFPYLYRKDGSVRDLREWTSDRVDQRSHPKLYDDRYRRYCEQLEFVSTQLDTVFERLQQAGLYESTTIVLHGDHGSRIRGPLEPSTTGGPNFQPAGSDPETYDYAGQPPPAHDLLDRFSTLLAVKPADAGNPVTDTRPGSLLRFLSEALPLGDDPQPSRALDAVYLFDRNSRPVAIPMSAF